MMSSNRRREANRKNACKSTGPRTMAGKLRSRENAIKHGLTAGIALTSEDEQAVLERLATWYPELQTSFDARQVVLASIRIERCQEEEFDRRTELKEMASDPNSYWDLERDMEASALGRKLTGNPELVALKLQSSREGRKWLRHQWSMLRMILCTHEKSVWNDDQIELVQDLLGIRPEFRESGMIRGVRDSNEAAKELVDTELRKLSAADLANFNSDMKLRERAKEGKGLDRDPQLSKLKRYEVMAKRDMKESERALYDQLNIAEFEEMIDDPVAVDPPQALIVPEVRNLDRIAPVPAPMPAEPTKPTRPDRTHLLDSLGKPESFSPLDIRMIPKPAAAESRKHAATEPVEPLSGNRKQRRAIAKQRREQAKKSEMVKRLAKI